MLNLIKADIYKIINKKSFLVTLLLIIFVSITYLVLINKYLKINVKENNPVPIMSESNYSSLYNGNYNNYIDKYKEYIDFYNKEYTINKKEFSNKTINILENSYALFYLIGIIIIFMSFNSLSYDYQHGSIKFLFISTPNKRKLIISKIISLFIISCLFTLISLITLLITSALLTQQNVFSITKLIIVNKSIKSINLILYYAYKLFLYLLPIIFIVVLTLFLTILFKGSSITIIVSLIMYLFSLTITNLAVTHNFNIIKYTFLPYLDFSYFEDYSNVILVNALYNVNFNYLNSLILFSIYTTILLIISFKLIKRDI